MLGRAKSFIDSLDFFGSIERFDESMVRLYYYLISNFPEFKASLFHENVTQVNMSLDDKLDRMKDELGNDFYQEVVDRSSMDLELYRYCLDRLDSIVE